MDIANLSNTSEIKSKYDRKMEYLMNMCNLDFEDDGSTFLQNTGNQLLKYMISLPRRK
jgi:hypothetical protein